VRADEAAAAGDEDALARRDLVGVRDVLAGH
jgi:hypothetical protein